MTTRTFTDLVLEATQILKHADAEKFAPVIRLLLAEEQKTRRKPSTRRVRKVHLATRDGRPARGGAGWVDAKVLDKAMEEK